MIERKEGTITFVLTSGKNGVGKSSFLNKLFDLEFSKNRVFIF